MLEIVHIRRANPPPPRLGSAPKSRALNHHRVGMIITLMVLSAVASRNAQNPGQGDGSAVIMSRVLSFRIPAACATHIIFHAFAAASSMAVSLSARLVACRVLGGVLVRSVGRAMACSAALEEHRALRQRFHSIGHDHHHEHTYWYHYLRALLREPAAAYYVEVLTVEHTDSRHEVEPWTVSVPSVEEVLIREAVEGEGWIAEPEKEKFMDQLLTGDEDAMVTLMILRMPNLKRLTLPTHCWGGLDFKHLMPIVAYIAQTASTADPGAGATLPLSQLEHYEGYLFNGSYGVDFEAIAPLMALPSLRTMCTPCNTEQGSGRRRYPNLACARSTFRMVRFLARPSCA
ncbi:hypothetical protein B0H14DRAFT_3868442 [Mycena olivaceomarginata]|nr:hypothetical protein B0H14DRAFT_3868442 [Mycena olivaceomarginata]